MGLTKGEGRRSTIKIERFTLNSSKSSVDNVNKWFISGKSASNRCQIGALLRKVLKIKQVRIKKVLIIKCFLKIIKPGYPNKLRGG